MADERAAQTKETLSKLRHDLRTPLNQIIGYTEMLQEVAADDLQADLAKVHAAAMNLVSGVDRAVGTFQALLVGEPRISTETPEAPEVVSAERATVEVDRDAAVAPRGLTLLVVDDNENNRAMLSRRLERKGFDVITADSGENALLVLEHRAIDLVLLDVMMPGLSGTDVLRKVRETRSMSDLPVIMATARHGSEDVVEALELGANDYVTKPIDLPVLLARANTQLALKEATERVRKLAAQLETRNKFIREAFGRYLTDEVVENLLAKPDGLALGGEGRVVTILMSDLRGFSSMAERLTPRQVVSLLNHYLGAMTEIIVKYGGTIDEFIGDAILVIFGAPVTYANHAERAIACALEMQLAMEAINENNRRESLPEIEMGIGINSGEVVVGNIGSLRRAKYGVVGRNVNLASRIEALTVGGQVLVSESARAEVGDGLRIDGELVVLPKGSRESVKVYEVGAISGSYSVSMPRRTSELVDLRAPLSVRYAVLDGVQSRSALAAGEIVKLSAKEAIVLAADAPVAAMSTVVIKLVSGDQLIDGELVGKVLRLTEGGFLLHFTAVAPAYGERLEAELARR